MWANGRPPRPGAAAPVERLNVVESIIIFCTLWGVALRERRGTSPRTHGLIAAGLAALILSTLIVGYGNYLGFRP